MTRRTRRVLALAMGLVLSTLLLGGGWLFSTWRERQTRMREARARLTRVASVVRGAVDESLEELRLREDERPFYLYGYYYSPPDVLAIADPVAVSPLARPPRDPRIVGHFQVDPGGAIRTPYTPDPDDPPHPLTVQVRDLVAAPRFASLRDMASSPDMGPEDPALGGETAPLGDVPMVAALAPRTSLLTVSVGDATTPQGAQAEVSEELERPERERAPLGALALGDYGSLQASDINAAQLGDEIANLRVLQRGRAVPQITRRDVTWSEAREQQRNVFARQQASPALPRRPSSEALRRALDAEAVEVLACAGGRDVVVRLRVRGEDGRTVGASVRDVDDEAVRSCVQAALADVRLEPFLAETLVIGYRYASATAEAEEEEEEAPPPSTAGAPQLADATGLDNMVQRETEVEYTPMTYLRLGDHLVLHRLVSHEGVAVVQGVLIDRDRLRDEWVPALVARHAPDGPTPTVIEAGTGACEVRAPASEVIDGIELCFAPGTLRAAAADLDAELGWQIAALLALLAIALLAAAAIVVAARRAEALSRQKSAFVSAVSHELRTPLTTLRMHAEMLEEGLVSDARRPKVHRELVRESVRLARLVDNVLSLSKLEEGRRRIKASDGDLRGHVIDVVEGQRSLVEERGFTLHAPAPEPPVEACFDRQAVEQIVVNLLDNAVKYGAGDENVIEVEVVAPATVIVRDRGPGIPEPERDKVFERFHRVEREEHAHAPGTGIGLALVQELAEAHGGSAAVRGREGGGAELRVRLTAAG